MKEQRRTRKQSIKQSALDKRLKQRLQPLPSPPPPRDLPRYDRSSEYQRREDDRFFKRLNQQKQQRNTTKQQQTMRKQTIKQAALDERNAINDLMNIGKVYDRTVLEPEDKERIERRAYYKAFLNEANNKNRFK